MVRVKICGITSVDDARLAVSAGADALGLVFAPSPRRLSPDSAAAILASVPPFVTPVAVFVDASLDPILDLTAALGISTVQLHGGESPELVNLLRAHGLKVIKAFRVASSSDLDHLDRFHPDAFLLDSRVPDKLGGTGLAFDWSLAVPIAARLPVILAGGLNPDNVADAVRTVRPYAVDCSSSVESAPGRKDPDKLRTFVSRAKSALS